jgi:chemotaxis protein methyltransferase CheR
MTDDECVALLQWALPRLRLRWPGYRKVRGQVCKRIRRRMAQLGLSEVTAYRTRLEADPAEWGILADLCAITISRFYRDRSVWDALRDAVLPAVAQAAIAAREDSLRCWSIGCACGEEPYTLSILWALGLADRYPALRLRVLATDLEERALSRARVADYAASSLRELPASWLDPPFERLDGRFRLRDRFRAPVELRREDVRLVLPEEVFRVILCRNVILTYFEDALQREMLARIATRLAEGGALIVGSHERLPAGTAFEPWHARLGIYRRAIGHPA